MDTPRHHPLKVGLFLQIFENPGTRLMPSWKNVLEIARHAEAVGFDSIWVPDHLFLRFDSGVYDVWEGWSMLSAIAASTSRVEVGSLVTCTNFRNPALLAKMAATVDEISGGRFTLGLGAGWHKPDFDTYGLPYDHRTSRFEEALVIIKTLLREGEVDFNGHYYSMRECRLGLRRTRDSGPPILIGAAGDRMLRLTARYADIWNRDFGPEGAIAQLSEWKARVDAACTAEGRDPESLARSAAVQVDMTGDALDDDPTIIGTPDQQAEALLQYAAAGISHVQVWLDPNTSAGLEAFARTLEILHRTNSTAA